MIFSNVVGNVVPGYRSCVGQAAWRYRVCHCGSADRFYRCRAFHRKQSCYGIWGLSTKKSPGHRLEKYGWSATSETFVGCLILSVIFVLAGASGTADYYAGFIGNKLSIPAGEMFFRAILCNFFVCLAVACGMKCKNEVAKFFMIILCIAGFVVAGFEHCVANMATFVTAALLVPGGISLTAALKSMVIVTIGNAIGGGCAPCLAASNDECR